MTSNTPFANSKSGKFKLEREQLLLLKGKGFFLWVPVLTPDYGC